MHQADGPEIVRKIFREQIRIRHREVTSFAPARAPRIAHGETLRFVVVAHRENGVAANDSFSRRRHIQHACFANLRALKAVVNGETKNKWITIGQTAFHLREGAVDTLITQGAKFFRVRVAELRRFLRRLGARGPKVGRRVGRSIVIGPFGFRARALFADTLDSIANLSAVVDRHTVLHASFVVINEQTRRDEIGEFLFLAIELDGRGDRVRGAGTDLSLIVNRRAMFAQIGLAWKWAQFRHRRRIEMIAIIG